ncbi:MFS transporter [Streptomyces sp. NPDC018045]|uniref:MFS transporter n=1 Tax=Streptomyces sp. NPDC018045 TaxID=3365037 RepID=UPI0037877E58
MTNAIRTFRIYVALLGFAYALVGTLQIVYQASVVGLSPFQLVLVGTVLEATVFLCEVPTGVVADRYSRRLSLIIGASLSGFAFVLQGLVPEFWAAVTCSFIWGVGFTFMSGSGQAWLADEIGPDNAQPVFTQGRQIDLVFTIVGTLAACLLGLRYLGLPLLVAGVTFLAVALFLAFFMPENGFKPTPLEDRETFSAMFAQVKTGIAAIRSNRVLLTMALVSLFVGLASEAVDRLWVDRILSDFTLPSIAGLDGPTVWFTVFTLVGTAISLVVSLTVNRVIPRTMNNRHPNRLMALMMAAQVAGIVLLGVSPIIGLALAGLWLRNGARDLAFPVQMAWMNRNLDSRARATGLSLNSQIDAFGQVTGGPSIGAVGSKLGVTAALAVSAVVLSPAIALYLALKPDRRGSTAPVEVAPGAPAERELDTAADH